MSLLERVRAAGPEPGSGGSGARDLREARQGLKAALVERLGLAAIAGMLSWEDPGRARDELGVALDAILNTQDFGSLSPDERSLLSRQILDEVCGLGPIQPLLEDDEITEVMINGCDALFYEREGELHAADTVFDSPEQIMIVLDRILAPPREAPRPIKPPRERSTRQR